MSKFVPARAKKSILDRARGRGGLCCGRTKLGRNYYIEHLAVSGPQGRRSESEVGFGEVWNITAANLVATIAGLLPDGPSRSRMLDGLGKLRPGCAHRRAGWMVWSKPGRPPRRDYFVDQKSEDRRRVARPRIHASDMDN